MHNGLLRDFPVVKRDLALAVDPDLYPQIEGSTDSELLFFLALTFGLETTRPGPSSARSVWSRRQDKRHGVEQPIQMTVATTDGERLWAFRYSSEGRSRTLFHSTDVSTLRQQYPDNPMLHNLSDQTRLVVSEPLGDLKGAWREIPEATCVVISGAGTNCSRSHPAFRRPRSSHPVCATNATGRLIGQPLLPSDGVLHLAEVATRQRLLPDLVESAHVSHPDRSHRCPRGLVDRHRLGEDPHKSQIFEPVPDQLPGTLARETPAPVATQQAVSQLGLAVHRPLIRPLRWLQNPPPDEHAVNEPNPEAQSGNGGRGGEPSPMNDLNLLTGTCVAQIPHDLRIGVQLHFVLQVVVGQRNKPDPRGLQHSLSHTGMIESDRSTFNRFSRFTRVHADVRVGGARCEHGRRTRRAKN
jgi:hypothetical protein